MADPNSKPDTGQKSEQPKPRNPGNPTDGHRQELDPKGGSRTEDDQKRDSFSGEKMPKH